MTSMRFTTPDGVSLNLESHGTGAPVVFQHGLCGDARQTANVFPKDIGHACHTVECRGHGQSEAGEARFFSLAQFTADVGQVIDGLTLDRVVVGGISMGASIALKLAAHHPDRVRALVLVRPALLFEPRPANQQPNILVGDLLKEHTPEEASRIFESGDMARKLAAVAPDNLASLRGFFKRQPTTVTSALLRQIGGDELGLTEDDLRGITVPALVIGNSHDYVHPLSMAQDMAKLLPRARFVEVTSKAKDAVAHAQDVRHSIAEFLKKEMT